ncbi:MAG: phosphomethylpyrimidine synthase ThiC [Desulfovibrionaceae bacterium]|nr:phosphomethylpyrimidine synthase ThiC [Desulfovibrionaceae bacterium]
MSLIEKNDCLRQMLDAGLSDLASREDLDREDIVRGLERGRMVLLANPGHKDVLPTLIGQPAQVKVNANIGTSPLADDAAAEMEKLAAAEQAGAHAVMDLSTAGDLDAIRRAMLAKTRLPLGTVPIYALAKRYADQDLDPAEFRIEEFLEEVESQARQGVDFMTVHCGVTLRGVRAAKDRVMGIVSRGGSILARWMLKRDQENPLLTHYDQILDIALGHNVVLSLGDGLRPGAGADAGDTAQWEEVIMLGELAKRARRAGVQSMIEGPGHVPLNLVQSQIQGIKKVTDNAPLYVLGPLVTDSAPGYDHIAGAVGGCLAAYYGADFLCYITPAEHLTLPCAEDVRLGVMASLVAAQGAEVALGRPRAVNNDLNISRARKKLDWEAVARLALDPDLVAKRRDKHRDEKECAMCGRFCAIRMLSE